MAIFIWLVDFGFKAFSRLSLSCWLSHLKKRVRLSCVGLCVLHGYGICQGICISLIKKKMNEHPGWFLTEKDRRFELPETIYWYITRCPWSNIRILFISAQYFPRFCTSQCMNDLFLFMSCNRQRLTLFRVLSLHRNYRLGLISFSWLGKVVLLVP